VVLFVAGQTACSICRRTIERGDSHVGFPHFLADTHPLWEHSDSAMHAVCYHAWPHRAALERELEAFKATQKPRLAAASMLHAEQRAADEARVAARNERHAAIVAAVRERGAACPRCHVVAHEYRELAGTASLRLVCLACARSFDASELVGFA
jgi:hypothetical protein